MRRSSEKGREERRRDSKSDCIRDIEREIESRDDGGRESKEGVEAGERGEEWR